jgi:hypothetical protein
MRQSLRARIRPYELADGCAKSLGLEAMRLTR